VMELLEGRPLTAVLDDSPGGLGVDRALHIFRHLLRGLAHAHRAGVVHRDVKPGNIFLVEHDGDPDFVKILDFGIAKLVGDALHDAGGKQLTQAGLAIGTPFYMSPEQGYGTTIDGRSDLYSASVVLFEMIAGQLPFDADDKLSILAMHASKEVPRFADVAPDVEVPPALEEAIRRGLAKRPEERYESAEEYAAALDQAMGVAHARPLTVVPVGARASSPSSPVSVPASSGAGSIGWAPTVLPTTPPPLLERVRRWRVPAAIAGGAVVAIGLVALLFAGDDERPAGAGRAAPIVAPADRGPAGEAERLRAAGDPRRARALLESQPTRLADDARAQLVLGHAAMDLKEVDDAMAAYLKAVKLDDDLGRDPILRTNLALALGDPRGREPAFALLGELARDRDRDAVAQVATLAVDDDYATRSRALALAEQLDIVDKVDRLKAYSLDLDQAPKCEQRRAAVAKLRALRDKRAIPALTRAQRRLRKGGILDLETVNANACLVDEAKAAVAELEKK